MVGGIEVEKGPGRHVDDEDIVEVMAKVEEAEAAPKKKGRKKKIQAPEPPEDDEDPFGDEDE
jgi:hypothetical protein